MPRGLFVAACTAVAVSVLTSGLSTPVVAATGATTSVSCPAVIRPIDADLQARAWGIAAQRLAVLSGPSTLPFGATGSGPYVRTSAYSWTSGFYPTSLWLMYQRTMDPVWLERARSYTNRVLPVARWRGTHDLGFMIGLPVEQALRLDPSTTRGLAYATALRAASRSLAARWNGNVRALRSSYYGGKWGLIIDSAMNAPMLIQTGLVYGGTEGRRLARRGTQHMLTLARAFVRPDGSTSHRLAFDPRTGDLIGPIYGQGLRTSSTWSRGQAWAVNGFATSYLLTKDDRLLAAARRTADFWISHVGAGCVPAWDFDVSDDAAPRDSSAAAIAVDGLLTLALVDPDAQRAATYRAYALATLGTLASAPWVTDAGRGVLQRQAYNIPADRREGTYAWGDAFLLRALAKAAANQSESG
jgi:unsaturated chondroitin disaccharide hydrolase